MHKGGKQMPLPRDASRSLLPFAPRCVPPPPPPCSALGRCAEAATRLSSLDLEADLSSRLLLALNLFREARFKESCHGQGKLYQSLHGGMITGLLSSLVYQQLSDEVVEKDKSPVLTAAAMAAFTLGSYDSCKALLFKA